MKNISNAVLLALIREGNIEVCLKARDELLSRLARGRKAIEAIEKVKQAYNKESNDMQFDDDIFKICCEYQQSCKEAADEK